jgi:hypothetical protein
MTLIQKAWLGARHFGGAIAFGPQEDARRESRAPGDDY